MAKPTNNLIGITQGSIKGWTFSILNGQQILKNKNVKAQDLPSPSQIIQREKMQLLASTFTANRSIILMGLTVPRNQNGPYNYFIHLNFTNGLVVFPSGAVEIDFGTIIFAQGNLEPTNFTVVQDNPNLRVLNPSWSDAITGNQNSTDIAYSFAYRIANQTWYRQLLNFERLSELGEITLDSDLADNEVIIVFLFFRQQGTNLISNNTSATFVNL